MQIFNSSNVESTSRSMQASEVVPQIIAEYRTATRSASRIGEVGPGGVTVFVASFPDAIARFTELLGREGAFADPGRVRLHDADDLIDVTTGDAGSRGDAQGGAVRAGDIGEGAVIDVEQTGIGALEEDGLVIPDRFVKRVHGVVDVGLEPLAHLEQGRRRIGIQRGGVESERASSFACSNRADDLQLDRR